MRCEEADALIDALVEDALDATTRRALDEHLSACARCGREVEASRALSLRIAAMPSASPSPAADARVLAAVAEEAAWSRRRARLRGAVAATVAAAAVGGVFVALPAGSWIAGEIAATGADAGAWLRSIATRAAAEAAGPAAAMLVAALLVVAIEKPFARRLASR